MINSLTEAENLISLLARLTWPLDRTTRRFLNKKRREVESKINRENFSKEQNREILRLERLIIGMEADLNG